jgi:hypothetical protein
MHAKIISSFPFKCHLARAASLLALLAGLFVLHIKYSLAA